MIDRRKTLLGLMTASAVTVCSNAFGLAGNRQADPVTQVPGTDDAVEAALRQDLKRMGERAYSDEGIPVFLACENLATPARVEPTALSASVAEDFRRNAAAWQKIHPDAAATDVSKVIEVLAERDFDRGSEVIGS